MFLNHTRTPSAIVAYAAWLTAVAAAHRSGNPDDRQRAERLYIESKHIERRVQRTARRMKIDNRPTGSEWRTA